MFQTPGGRALLCAAGITAVIWWYKPSSFFDVSNNLMPLCDNLTAAWDPIYPGDYQARTGKCSKIPLPAVILVPALLVLWFS